MNDTLSNSINSGLSRLEAEASALNEAAGTLNHLIDALNERLAPMDVGIEFFLPTHLECVDVTDGDDDNQDQIFHDVTVLGYARAAGKWQLAIGRRTEASVKHPELAHDQCVLHSLGEWHIQPLRAVSRDLRTKAAGYIPELLSQLASEVQRRRASVTRLAEAVTDIADQAGQWTGQTPQ